MSNASRAIFAWLVFALAITLAGALWKVDVEALLWAPSPNGAWFLVALLWIEIACIVTALLRRFLRAYSGFGLVLIISCAAAAVNFAILTTEAPGLLFG